MKKRLAGKILDKKPAPN